MFHKFSLDILLNLNNISIFYYFSNNSFKKTYPPEITRAIAAIKNIGNKLDFNKCESLKSSIINIVDNVIIDIPGIINSFVLITITRNIPQNNMNRLEIITSSPFPYNQLKQ